MHRALQSERCCYGLQSNDSRALDALFRQIVQFRSKSRRSSCFSRIQQRSFVFPRTSWRVLDHVICIQIIHMFLFPFTKDNNIFYFEFIPLLILCVCIWTSRECLHVYVYVFHILFSHFFLAIIFISDLKRDSYNSIVSKT